MLNENLTKFRENLKMSQKDFAASLGYKQNTYNGYETGLRSIKTDLLEDISKKYSVSVDYLLGLSDNPKIQKPLTSDESEARDERLDSIIECYKGMNDDGKESLAEQAEMHFYNPKYKKPAKTQSEIA